MPAPGRRSGNWHSSFRAAFVQIFTTTTGAVYGGDGNHEWTSPTGMTMWSFPLRNVVGLTLEG